jgi:hypothetical protein
MLFPYLTILLLLHGTAPSIASPSTATSTSASTITRTESYAEQLRITPLVDGKVHSEFNFIMRSAGDAEEESTGELLGSNSIGSFSSLFTSSRSQLETEEKRMN